MKLARITSFVQQEIVPRVNRFRALQSATGAVRDAEPVARELLNHLRGPVRAVCEMTAGGPALADAFDADVEAWLAAGLGRPPFFDRIAACVFDLRNGEPIFLIGPIQCPNGLAAKGQFLEALLAVRHEPFELVDLARLLPTPENHCRSCRFLAGSDGFGVGNCIVAFSENLSTSVKARGQTFALFLLNKFYPIYQSCTRPMAEAAAKGSRLDSFALDPAACYNARCVWAYLHEHFHQSGPRPLHCNLHTKVKFHAGLLEEVKVDCQTVVTAHRSSLPFAGELLEFVLFERLLRYPRQPDATRNFDSGTGFLLFEYLRRTGFGITCTPEGASFEPRGCLAGLERLTGEIKAIESEPSDDRYLGRSRALVEDFLPPGRDGDRFSMPAHYKTLVPDFGNPLPVINATNLSF